MNIKKKRINKGVDLNVSTINGPKRPHCIYCFNTNLVVLLSYYT